MRKLDGLYIGFVEDNNDPKKLGRCRIRVATVFDQPIPTEDIPWAIPVKDLNGNQFSIPEVGKVLVVSFSKGNKYKPEYAYAEHYNINLENKLKSLSDDDYTTFKSLLLDGPTQIYRSLSEGLKLDHEFTNINLDSNGNINLNLRDNLSKVNIGSPDASQAAILGTAFMEWFTKLMLCMKSNLAFSVGGSPVNTTPALIEILNEFQQSVIPKFLSTNVWIVDNLEVQSQERDYIAQSGDKWTGTETINNLSKISATTYKPEPRAETGRPIIKDSSVPNDITAQTIQSEANIQTIDVPNYPNGQVPTSAMILNKNLSKTLAGDAAYLMKDASNALDLMMQAYDVSSFSGKQKIVFTDGYRSLSRQQALYTKYGSGRAAKPGTSNHGWGIAIDMYWGVRTSMFKDNSTRPSGYKHPVYKWFLENGHLYGWYNPSKLRDDSGTDEWWHWEYHGVNKGAITDIASRYKGEFTAADIANIKSAGGTYV